MKRFGWVVSAAALFAWAGSAVADSITPASVTATLGVGESTTISKTVTVSPGGASRVDVYFLADTTGSMGGAIGAVRASAASILTSAAGLGDVGFAVGEYKDNGDVYVYRLNQDVTTSQAAATAGINMWAASGGGDYQEADLYALQQVADTTGWRAGSEKVLVWFGDASGHDPSGPTGVTEAQATAALVAQSINVQAVDVGTMGDAGQPQRITAATGGNYYSGIDNASIVATIEAAITTAVETYSKVAIDTSEVPAGVTVTVVPSDHSGSFDRTVERTFGFDVTFKGDAAGVYNFNLYGTVDGGRVATEADSITVRGVKPLPDGGSSLFLLGTALGGLAMLRRRLA